MREAGSERMGRSNAESDGDGSYGTYAFGNGDSGGVTGSSVQYYIMLDS